MLELYQTPRAQNIFSKETLLLSALILLYIIFKYWRANTQKTPRIFQIYGFVLYLYLSDEVIRISISWKWKHKDVILKNTVLVFLSALSQSQTGLHNNL